MEPCLKRRPLFDWYEFRRLFALMAPLFIANVLHMGMALIDTLVAGKAGAADLAGVALGGAVCFPILFACGATLSIVGPIIARLRGASKLKQVGHVLNNAKLLAFAVMLVAMSAMYAGSFVFEHVTNDAQIADVARLYVLFVLFTAPASMILRVVQGNFEGYGQTRPAMLMALGALILNYPLNYAFVFGWGFIPAMGGAGCGLSTAILHWIICSGLIALTFLSLQHRANAKKMWSLRAPDMVQVKRIISLGFPMGVASFCEMVFFCAVTLIVGPLGKMAVSSHQVALNISNVMFMLPVSLGVAASIRGAFHIGNKNKEAFHRMVSTLLISTFVGVLMTMLVTVSLRYQILGAFTNDWQIIDLAQFLVILCALYQIPDALQAIMGGLLRACHDTKIITPVNISSYWLLGFPLAYVLVRTDWIVPAMGPAGAWIAFIISLSFAAVLLTRRFISTARKIFNA